MDGINSFAGTFTMFFEELTMRLLRLTKIRALPHWTLFSFFIKNSVLVLLPSSPFCRCSFIGMVFQGKCVVLSDLFFCPSMFRQVRAIFCVLKPSFKNRLALTILRKFGFSQHVTCFVIHCLTQWLTMPRTSGLVLLNYVSRNRQQAHLSLFNCRLFSVGCMRNLDTVSSKESHRTRRSRYWPFQLSNPLILDWNGWSPPISQSLSATFSCLCDFQIVQLIV